MYSKDFLTKWVYVMNKFCLMLLLSLCTTMAYAEKGDVVTEVKQIIEFSDINKNSLYSASKQWVATNFKSANSVIQMDDKEEGVLIGKGTIDYPCTGNSWQCGGLSGAFIKFTLKIETKDNKVRITFSDITHYDPNVIIDKKPFETQVKQLTKYDNLTAVRNKFDEIIKDYEMSIKKIHLTDNNW